MSEAKKLSFGLMRLPVKTHIQTRIDIEATKEMVDYFIDNGFTHFDTSIVYHGGKSETAFKKAVAERYDRKAFTITDKMPMFIIKTKSALETTFNKELKRCGVDYFDYYWLHSLDTKNYANCEKTDAFSYLQKKKEEGKIIHTGFSFHGSAELLDEILTKHPEVEFVQLQINYLDWEDEKVQARKNYEVARKHGKRIMVMEPVKGGALAKPSPAAQKLLSEYDSTISPAVWALRFCASLEGVDFVLSGMSNLEQLKENVEAMDNFKPLSEEETALLFRVAEVIKNGVEIPCTACRYCVDACPKEILIPDYFNLYNGRKQDEKKAKTEFKSISKGNGKPSDCISCHACEQHCPQHLEISNYMKTISKGFK